MMKYWNELTSGLWALGGLIAFGNAALYGSPLGALWLMWAAISFLAAGYYLSAKPIPVD
jgi:hypothetical protein